VAKEVKPAAKQAKPVEKETKPAVKEQNNNKEEKSVARAGRPNIFQRAGEGIKHYFNETVGELRKVSWPTRKEAWSLTVIVLIVTGVMSAVLGSFDYIFSKIFEFVLQLSL